jgi:cation transport regulator ChaC
MLRALGSSSHVNPKFVKSRSFESYHALAREVLAKLPAKDSRHLGPTDRTNITRTLAKLLFTAQRDGLDYVPVFGYLSLIDRNHRELGKSSQKKVKAGREVVSATLSGYSVAPVASTVLRGTSEHPGLVAGLSQRLGGLTRGVVLKIPFSEAPSLMPLVLAREVAAENDLRPDGTASPLMYRPTILPVRLGTGRTVQALVFASNPKSLKSLADQDIFADTDNREGQPSPGALAWMMSAHGERRGHALGAHASTSAEYWRSYVAVMKARRLPIEPWIVSALAASRAAPTKASLEAIVAQAKLDSAAMAELDDLNERFGGAATPVEYRRLQLQPTADLSRPFPGEV